jgi:hypothetical protein
MWFTRLLTEMGGREKIEHFLGSRLQTLIDASKEVGLEVYVGVSGPECRPKSGNKNRKQIV